MSNVETLRIAQPTHQDRIEEMLRELLAMNMRGEILGLMVTSVHPDQEYKSWTVGNVPIAERIGYMMCQVDSLIRGSRGE